MLLYILAHGFLDISLYYNYNILHCSTNYSFNNNLIFMKYADDFAESVNIIIIVMQ